ncbi:YdcF family protein [Lunatibacter salilacus]|uniref:YdcF family protein n=1 Tax=Lunatibacter salilacus TaxID=2483804 RepID=UPI00131C4201|nr:YdcF family protein [Lunatibacter salilacus]
MFFYVSQLFSFLATPLTLILILLISGFLARGIKWKKRLSGIGILMLLLFTNNALSTIVINNWEPTFKVIKTLPEYEIGIVLTGVTNINKTADDRTFFDRGADRATHAVQLYKEGKLKRILITGGQGFQPRNDQKEAILLANFMITAGVLESDLIIEDKAKNTRENALFTKRTLEERGQSLDQRFLLITSAFHMKRAEGCFRKIGLQVDTFPVDYYGNDNPINIRSLIQPSPNALVLWNKLSKEWIGLLAYRIAGYI